ncbi:hypothetical protein MmiEs2_09070 [Methanimicrococcus stummii]|uniref:Uncharacterized protein n=1 Tax=Methanimicrococcus stummii TaxID=3028294 RepID=A0AA96V8G8_9EURY|nr:hypothetical protein [Methanimicrococcus sp. Es2]WNY28704.1 hypothetical protein MmiEs2_09070 [Methanimicrococcus sp. Es2]
MARIANTKIRLVRTDSEGDDTSVVKEWDVDVQMSTAAEATPTEREWLEAEALGASLKPYDKLRLEMYNPLATNQIVSGTLTKIFIPYRKKNMSTKKSSNLVMTAADFDKINAGNVTCYPQTWTSLGEYIAKPKTAVKLGHLTANGLDKNNDRVLIVPYAP